MHFSPIQNRQLVCKRQNLFVKTAARLIASA
ncbi:hypothetical protein M726_11280 [Neisseria gonorrhoeae ATL_2011_01_17]|nr:hypothetical protein M726_11280 [Neisseria gonorrhoeae ATL_2011_01_17]